MRDRFLPRRLTFTAGLIPALLCFLVIGEIAFAQPQSGTLRVATRLVRPFVFEQGGQLTGFSIELWREISSEMNIKSEFAVKPTVQEILRSVNDKDSDLGRSEEH